MAILSPDDVLLQAERLVTAPPHGPPKQVDLRRAISAAYYALFHFTSAALADQLVGYVHRRSARYSLIYRSIDHHQLSAVCAIISRNSLPNRYARYAPPGGFNASIKSFSATVVDLQQRRHRADYDPGPRFKTADAMFAVIAARTAIGRFPDPEDDARKMFLTLVLSPPRSS